MRQIVKRAIVLIALSIGIDAGAAPAQAPRVLLVYDDIEIPGVATIDEGLSNVLTAASPAPQVFREILELSQFGLDDYAASLREHLRLKYSRIPPDVIVAVGGAALDFLLGEGSPVFPDVPIVIAGLEPADLAERNLIPGVTGVLMERTFSPTVDLALRLHPGTERFVFVSGVGDFDVRLAETARREFGAYADRYQFVYLDTLSVEEMVSAVSRLPPRTVLLISSVFTDASGSSFAPHEVVQRLTAAANRPAYGFVDHYLGRGVVGGRMYSLELHSRLAAELVLRILGGEDPATIPIATADIGQTLIDARQLERWGISERRLPDDAVVRLRDTTFWSRYRRYGLAGSGIILFQALIIGALLFQHTKRRRAEADLRESESRFRILADNAPLMIWMSGPDGLTRYFNRAWHEFIGRVPEEDFDDVLARSIHPDDLERCMRTYHDSVARGERFTFEYRMRRHDGIYRWILCTGAPMATDASQPRGYIGSCIDITMRKEAEFEQEHNRAELAHLNRIAAMAELTASLAHELNQPLGALLMNATTARRLLERKRRPIAELHSILADIQGDGQRAADIIRRMRALLQKREMTTGPVDVNRVVTEVLQLTGYEAHRRSIAIRFVPGVDVPPVLGDRVHLQQVVLNLLLNAFDAVKSAAPGERQVRVVTELTPENTVRLSVADSGCGIRPEWIERLFEPFYSTKEEGLGLGLSITRTIVEAHHGAVWAESDGLAGATFHVELPSVWCQGPLPDLTEKCPIRRAATLFATHETVAAPPAG